MAYKTEYYTERERVSYTDSRIDFTGFEDVTVCRPRFLYFKFTGLMPNTRHWFFFDKTDVTNYINTTPSVIDEFYNLDRANPKLNPGEKYVRSTGFPAELGGPTGTIYSNSSGEIVGIFYLQSNSSISFPAGVRTLTVIDISNFDPQSNSVLSLAQAQYTVDAGVENYAKVYFENYRYEDVQKSRQVWVPDPTPPYVPDPPDNDGGGYTVVQADDNDDGGYYGSIGIGPAMPGYGPDDGGYYTDSRDVDLPGNAVSRALGIGDGAKDNDDDGYSGEANDGCVIATHGVASGGFTPLEKAKAVLWCERKYHGTFFGEALRRGYRYTAGKAIERGDAEKYYQEFKDFVSYGRGVKKGLKYAVRYYYRTVYFIAHGLFLKK